MLQKMVFTSDQLALGVHMFRMFTLRGSFRQPTRWKEWQQGLRMVRAGDRTHYWESAGFVYSTFECGIEQLKPCVFTMFLHVFAFASTNTQYQRVIYHNFIQYHFGPDHRYPLCTRLVCWRTWEPVHRSSLPLQTM